MALIREFKQCDMCVRDGDGVETRRRLAVCEARERVFMQLERVAVARLRRV